jgi:Uma2 family endonuclease
MIVKATEIKNNFGKYLELLKEEDIVVIRNGTPVARLTALSGWEGSGRVFELAEEYSCGGIKISYEEFMKMYENTDERYEYIDGEAYLMASPKITHQKVLGNLHVIFRQWFKGKPCTPYLSPFDVTLIKGKDKKNVVQPDLLVACDPENKNEKDQYTGTPALVIEILSESSKRLDLIKKLDLYSQTGVREYWIVNYLNNEVTVYEFKEKEIAKMKTYTKNETVRSFIFEGLAADMDEILE